MNPTVIKFHFPSKKIKIIDRNIHPGYKFRGLRGGRGSGKSWSFLLLIVRAMLEYPVFVVCGREIQKSLKESSYKLLVDTINRLGVGSDFEILRDEVRCITTGARCIFVGLKANPEAIKSLESAHILYLEEASQVSMESWRILIPTMRAKGWEIWCSWNPKLPTDPVEIVFEEEKHRAIVATVTYLDNKYLDSSKVEEAEAMKARDLELYGHVYLGHFAPIAGNTVIPLRDILAARDRACELLDVPVIAALDVAHMGDDDNYFIVRKGNHILHEESLSKSRDSDTALWASELCLEWKVAHLIVDVGGGIGVFQQIEDLHMVKSVHQFNGAWGAPTEYLNKRAECWFLMAKWLQTACLPPTSRRLMDEMMSQTYKMTLQNRKQLESKTKMDDSPDAADALSMTFLPNLDLTPAVDLSKLVKVDRISDRTY